jgi:hypothetical protein
MCVEDKSMILAALLEQNIRIMSLSSSAPVPPLAEGHMVDLIHHYSYSIVHQSWPDHVEDDDESEPLTEHFHALQYFHRLLGNNTPEFGRLANRVKLAELVYMTIYHDDDKPMFQWDRHDWELLNVKLFKTQQSLVRKDANSTVHDAQDERHHLDDERAKSPLYNKHYKHILQLILVHQALAPIREQMETDFNNKQWDLPSVDQKSLQQIR